MSTLNICFHGEIKNTMKTYIMGTHLKCLSEVLLMSINISFPGEILEKYALSGVMHYLLNLAALSSLSANKNTLSA